MSEEFVEFHHIMKVEYKAISAFFIGSIGTIIVAWILGVPFGNLMSKIDGTFVYHLVPFVASTTLFAILIYKSQIRGIKGLGFLATAVLLNGLSEFLYMISDPSGGVFQRGDNYIAAIGDLAFPIAVIFIYLHVELIEKRSPDLIHAVLILGTAFPLIVGEILVIFLSPLNIFSDIIIQIERVVLVYLGFFAVIIIWISLFGLRIMYGTLKHSDDKEIARASMFMLVGFSSLLTNFLLLGVGYSSNLRDNPLLFQGNEFVIYNTWLLSLALLILLFAYVFNPKFAFAVNFDVYQLIVIHAEQGITLFSFINEIRNEQNVKSAALQSPAILAITTLVKEIASTEAHVVLIKFDKNKEMIFTKQNEIVSVLITQKNSYFLQNGLNGFTKKFYEYYESNITDFDGNVGVFEDATKFIKTELPFMRHESQSE